MILQKEPSSSIVYSITREKTILQYFRQTVIQSGKKKIIIKKGVHSSSLNNELYYSKEDREKIVSAIENFLQ